MRSFKIEYQALQGRLFHSSKKNFPIIHTFICPFRILKQLNCYWQNQKQGSCFRCFFSRKLTIWEIFFTSFSEIQPSLLQAQHFLAFRIILPLLLLKLMTQIFWVSLWIFVFWGLTNSPPSDVKVNLGGNPWIMVNFWVLKGQLWVLTCIPAVHFSAISVNFSRGWLFLMYRNSRVHPLFKFFLNPTLSLIQNLSCYRVIPCRYIYTSFNNSNFSLSCHSFSSFVP